MAFVREDETGKMNDFEATAAYLRQYDSVAKKRAGTGSKRDYGYVASVSSLMVTTRRVLNPRVATLQKRNFARLEWNLDYKVKEYPKL